MDGIFHPAELMERSLTGQGHGTVPGVRRPVGKIVAEDIASKYFKIFH